MCAFNYDVEYNGYLTHSLKDNGNKQNMPNVLELNIVRVTLCGHISLSRSHSVLQSFECSNIEASNGPSDHVPVNGQTSLSIITRLISVEILRARKTDIGKRKA
jgi:hypothetical protein